MKEDRGLEAQRTAVQNTTGVCMQIYILILLRGFLVMEFYVLCVAIAMLVSGVEAAGAPDCTAEIEKMQPCLAFVENQVNIPSSACCKGLMAVHLNSPVCLCQLLYSRPTTGHGVNVTSALLLPGICKVHTDSSRCPALLAGKGAPEPSPEASAEKGHSGSWSYRPHFAVTCLWLLVAGYLSFQVQGIGS